MKKLTKTTPLASKISKLGYALAGAACCLSLSSLNAAVRAYENFDYAGSTSLNTGLNGGTGWSSAWANNTSGVLGPSTSGTDQSLYFRQSPGFATDGSRHIFADDSSATERNWTTAVPVFTQDFYFTALVRGYAGATTSGFGQADLRFEFFDGADATSFMRANVGITDGTLFADATDPGYGVGATSTGAITADDQTYLLAMKRIGNSGGIYASLILADGNLSTISSEPTWQVFDPGNTGATLESFRIVTDGDGDGGYLIDELTIATTWADAVSNITVVPEPATYSLLAGFLALSAVALRRRARS